MPIFETPTADDVFRCDPPEGLDKYDLKKWLVGQAVTHGWTWRHASGFTCELRRRGLVVFLVMVPGGLILRCHGRERVFQTEM